MLSQPRLPSSRWQSHLNPQGAQISIHRQVLPADWCCVQLLNDIACSRNLRDVPRFCRSCTGTGTHHHCSLSAPHPEMVSAASGSQRSPGCQRNHPCRGEVGRGSRCVPSPSSLCSRCRECCASDSRCPLSPAWEHSRYLFIKKPVTYP